jgi:hypothetical protein
MTKLLEKAIATIRDLPDSEQDEAAEMMLSLADRIRGPVRLDDETRLATKEGQEQVRRGEFGSDAKMADFFRRHRK